MRCRDISPDTAKKLNDDIFDGHANLYYHFIKKSVQHLNHGGELIFVTPRDFIRATGAAGLNEWLYAQGAFTHFKDYGDERIFSEFSPNCAVWRFVKGRRVPERWMTVAFFVASTDYYILAAATAIASVIILMSKSAPSAVRMMFLRTKTATKRLFARTRGGRGNAEK